MDTQDVYNRAKERVEDKIGFYTHLAAYVVVNAFLIFINFNISSDYLWFKWPLLGWGIALILHGLNVFLFSGESSIKERMIEREINNQKKR